MLVGALLVDPTPLYEPPNVNVSEVPEKLKARYTCYAITKTSQAFNDEVPVKQLGVRGGAYHAEHLEPLEL